MDAWSLEHTPSEERDTSEAGKRLGDDHGVHTLANFAEPRYFGCVPGHGCARGHTGRVSCTDGFQGYACRPACMLRTGKYTKGALRT